MLRCLLVCLLCILSPSVSHAGPIGDSLRAVSAQQAASAPAKSRQGVWVGGIVLTVVGGAMTMAGASRTKPDEPVCQFEGLLTDCRSDDPNLPLIGAGAAAVGAGIIMIILGRSKPAPQIIATPGKFAIQHTVKF